VVYTDVLRTFLENEMRGSKHPCLPHRMAIAVKPSHSIQ